MLENKIIVIGILQPEHGSGRIHLQDYIYDSNGIAPALTARDYKSPREVLVRDELCQN